MDFKNWILLIIIFGVVGFSAFAIYNNSQQQINSDPTPSPSDAPRVASDSSEISEKWTQYSGRTLDFYHPPDWSPEDREPFGGAVIEDIQLNIPDARDDYIFYSATPYDSVEPEDISEESTMTIKDRSWTEWVREGEDYVSYDYFTKDRIEDAAGSFGIHVTLSDEDEQIRVNLVELIKTLDFKTLEENPVEGVTPTGEQEATTSADSL